MTCKKSFTALKISWLLQEHGGPSESGQEMQLILTSHPNSAERRRTFVDVTQPEAAAHCSCHFFAGGHFVNRLISFFFKQLSVVQPSVRARTIWSIHLSPVRTERVSERERDAKVGEAEGRRRRATDGQYKRVASVARSFSGGATLRDPLHNAGRWLRFGTPCSLGFGLSQ